MLINWEEVVRRTLFRASRGDSMRLPNEPINEPTLSRAFRRGKRVVERPWADVAADMTELPRSKNQFKHLLVFQDLFTRWVEIKPLRSADAKAVVGAMEESILFLVGNFGLFPY